MTMANKAPGGVPRPRSERSITERQYVAVVPISDLNAEIHRRRWARRREAVVRIGIFLFACVIAFGLVLLAGRGSRR